MVVVTARKQRGECIGGSADEHRPRTSLDTPTPAAFWVDVLTAKTHPDEEAPRALPHLGALLHPISLLHRNLAKKSVGDERSDLGSYYYIAHTTHHAGETHLTRSRGENGSTLSKRIFDTTPPRAIGAGRFAILAHHGKVGRQQEAARCEKCRKNQATSWLRSRDRNCNTAREWICETRLSVTPSTSPISASVRFSS